MSWWHRRKKQYWTGEEILDFRVANIKNQRRAWFSPRVTVTPCATDGIPYVQLFTQGSQCGIGSDLNEEDTQALISALNRALELARRAAAEQPSVERY
jgi:uncharacterized membrane protein